MRNVVRKSIATVVLGLSALHAHAITYAIDPVQDGRLYLCDGCATSYLESATVLTDSYIQGLLRFATPKDLQPTDRIELSLSPYSLPLRGPKEAVYGYESYSLDVTDADKNAGSFLGNIDIPSNALFGMSFNLDVTDFVKSAQAPYITFNLRSTDLNVFTSIRSLYSRPAQLWVTSVPEPSTSGLFALGLIAGFGLFKARQHRSQSPSSSL